METLLLPGIKPIIAIMIIGVIFTITGVILIVLVTPIGVEPILKYLSKVLSDWLPRNYKNLDELILGFLAALGLALKKLRKKYQQKAKEEDKKNT